MSHIKIMIESYQPRSHIQQIADYIKKNLAKGYTIDSLKFSLLNQGYSRTSIEQAEELVNKQLAEQAPAMKEKPQITYRMIPEGEDIEKPGIFKRFFNWMFE